MSDSPSVKFEYLPDMDQMEVAQRFIKQFGRQYVQDLTGKLINYVDAGAEPPQTVLDIPVFVLKEYLEWDGVFPCMQPSVHGWRECECFDEGNDE